MCPFSLFSLLIRLRSFSFSFFFSVRILKVTKIGDFFVREHRYFLFKFRSFVSFKSEGKQKGLFLVCFWPALLCPLSVSEAFIAQKTIC